MKENILKKKWIIFGAGNGHIYRYLLEKYWNNIIAIVDNDCQKWESTYNGIKMHSPNWLKDVDKEQTIVIIATYGHWEEISAQLEELGWKDNSIIAKTELECINSYEFLHIAMVLN